MKRRRREEISPKKKYIAVGLKYVENIELKGLLYFKWETKPICHETVLLCLFLALIFFIQFYQSVCSTSVRGWMGVDAYMRAVVVYVRVCVCVHVCMCVRVCAFVLLCFCEHCACLCVCLGEFVHVWGWSFKGEWEQLKLERKRERTSVSEFMWLDVRDSKENFNGNLLKRRMEKIQSNSLLKNMLFYCIF